MRLRLRASPWLSEPAQCLAAPMMVPTITMVATMLRIRLNPAADFTCEYHGGRHPSRSASLRLPTTTDLTLRLGEEARQLAVAHAHVVNAAAGVISCPIFEIQVTE